MCCFLLSVAATDLALRRPTPALRLPPGHVGQLCGTRTKFKLHKQSRCQSLGFPFSLTPEHTMYCITFGRHCPPDVGQLLGGAGARSAYVRGLATQASDAYEERTAQGDGADQDG